MGVGVGPAQATIPGNPGVPQAPTVVYTENFENNVGSGGGIGAAPPGSAPLLLTSYVGATGETYTADPAWLSGCNGEIVSASSPNGENAQAGCNPGSDGYDALRQLSYAEGVFQGAADPTAATTVAALTDNPGPGANKVQFQTVQPIPLVASNRFSDVLHRRRRLLQRQ